MAEEQITSQPGQQEAKRELPAGVIAGVVFMAAVLAGVYFVIEQQSRPVAQPAPTQEAEAYLRNLGMADAASRREARRRLAGRDLRFTAPRRPAEEFAGAGERDLARALAVFLPRLVLVVPFSVRGPRPPQVFE